MKYNKSLTAFAIIIAAAFSALAQAPAGKTKPAPGLERKIFKKLIRLPYYGVFDHITFKVDDGTVTLSGKVAVARNRKDAESEVKRLEGVREVINRIEVLPPSPFDNRIRRRVLQTLATRGMFRYLQEPFPSVRLIVDGGRLVLEGYVANRGDYNLINVLSSGVSDVFSVRNNLLIEKNFEK